MVELHIFVESGLVFGNWRSHFRLSLVNKADNTILVGEAFYNGSLLCLWALLRQFLMLYQLGGKRANHANLHNYSVLEKEILVLCSANSVIITLERCASVVA